MPARMSYRASRNLRGGFVLPLSLFLLLTMSLLVALLIDSALQELRTSRGDLAVARAEAAAGSALSDLLAGTPDGARLALARGTASAVTWISGTDTLHASSQSLGGGLVRFVAGARTWAGGVRADATTIGFTRIVTDSAGPPGALRYRRLPGWWWAELP